uniref:Uncharacterized protein n=2 Tax=Alloprevotella tannerae TaxID=76122 RepID=A0A929RW31_9BACT|nr:hypothetical protein [Alloprevotella tannerae]
MNSAKYRFELSEMDSRRTHTHFRSTHYAPARRRAIPAASIIEKGIHIIYIADYKWANRRDSGVLREAAERMARLRTKICSSVTKGSEETKASRCKQKRHCRPTNTYRLMVWWEQTIVCCHQTIVSPQQTTVCSQQTKRSTDLHRLKRLDRRQIEERWGTIKPTKQ